MQNYIYYFAALSVTLCTLATSAQFVMADGNLFSNLQKLKVTDIVAVTQYTPTIKVDLHGNVIKPGDPVPAKNIKDLNSAKITWDHDGADSRYTLMLLDLDRKSIVPNITNSHVYNQYTSLNIPGNVITLGQTIVAFEQPIVPCQPGSKHRLLMLALKQDQSLDIADIAYMSASTGQSSRRENFKIEEFINRHRLEVAAANVFLALGETNGVCSSSTSLYQAQQSILPIMIAMVIAVTVFGFSKEQRSIFN